MGVDDDNRVVSFLEKPKDPPGMPGQPEMSLASMGIYVFNTDVMYELLFQDAAKKEASNHDFGRDIIPAMIAGGSRVFAYPFRDENRKEAAYWRDVGTLDAYFQTSMDLIQIDPILNLYDQDWPIHTYQPPYPPPKFVHTEGDRRGAAFNSIVCQGAIISGGQVYRSIVSPGVRINSYALVEDSILLRRRRGRPPCPHPPRHRRQGRPHPHRLRDRLEPRGRPRPGLHRHRRWHHRRRQGGRPGAVRVRWGRRFAESWMSLAFMPKRQTIRYQRRRIHGRPQNQGTQWLTALAQRGRSQPTTGSYFLSLELENVRCFSEKQILDLSDGNDRPARWTILLGENGTGKTTILQCLSRFEHFGANPRRSHQSKVETGRLPNFLSRRVPTGFD